jgi:monofunctional biosynthetic peptidoglycan transglycosylase
VRILRAVVLSLVLLLLLGAGWLVFAWPPPFWYRTHFPSSTAFMRSRERQYRAARDTTPLRYRPVSLDSITKWLPQAAVAGEDEAFYTHHGIDWHNLRLALGYPRDQFSWGSPRDRVDLSRAIRSAPERRDKLRGASTITQQLAKNLWLSSSRSPLRKAKEALLAYRLEWALPKDRIMELYLNVVELGPNTWGVEAAGQRYFNRGASRLTLDQAAMLVATLPHPLSSNPSYRPGRTRYRQQLILRKLRGENVEVPPEVEEQERPPLKPRADSLPPLDTTELPADTAVVKPRETTTAPVDSPRAPPDTARKP